MKKDIDRSQGAGTAWLLSELRGKPVRTRNNKNLLGRLGDFVIVETETLPHVTGIIVKRHFSLTDLFISIDEIESVDESGITIENEHPDTKPAALGESTRLLADFVLDKKIIDLEDRELSVVYDVRMLRIDTTRKMYVTDVEVGRKGWYSRLGLTWLARRFVREELVSWASVQHLPHPSDADHDEEHIKALQENLSEMPPEDVADIIEELDSEHRTEVLRNLGEEAASDALEEIEPDVQRQIIAAMEPGEVARLVDQMTPPQAADIIDHIPEAEQQAILVHLDPDLVQKIRAINEKQAESVIHFTTERFICLPAGETVGSVRDHFAEHAAEKDVTMYIYVTGVEGDVVGVLDLEALLLAGEGAMLGDIMTESVVSLEPDGTLKDAIETFRRYGFRALPVLDEGRILRGVLLYKDVRDLKD